MYAPGCYETLRGGEALQAGKMGGQTPHYMDVVLCVLEGGYRVETISLPLSYNDYSRTPVTCIRPLDIITAEDATIIIRFN